MNEEIKILTNQRTVTLAATPERINETTTPVTERRVISITIRANTGNAGNLYVLETTDRGAHTTKGYILAPGENVSLDVHDIIGSYIDLANVWVGSDNNSEGFSYIAIKEVF